VEGVTGFASVAVIERLVAVMEEPKLNQVDEARLVEY
jgi:hypothetical protein